jgi:hypothetical protein
MIEVEILSDDFGGYKSRANILPVMISMREIGEKNVNVRFSRSISNLSDRVGVVLVEDNFMYNVGYNIDVFFDLIKRKSKKVVFLDTSDSTGSVNSSVVSNVDKYLKRQLLEDREKYLESWRGRRLYTDYYRRREDWNGGEATVEGERGPQVKSRSDLDKLGVFWNIGMDVQFPASGTFFNHVPEGIAARLPWTALLNFPGVWASVGGEREVDVSGRFATTFDNDAIERHRKLMVEKLSRTVDTEKVFTLSYWNELRKSKLLLSPFGWGEICRRDFEGFMSGALLIKPSMSHLETWPPLYEDGRTMLGVNWDMSDLNQKIDWALENEGEAQAIAREGQSEYHKYIAGDSARELFADRFAEIVT